MHATPPTHIEHMDTCIKALIGMAATPYIYSNLYYIVHIMTIPSTTGRISPATAVKQYPENSKTKSIDTPMISVRVLEVTNQAVTARVIIVTI